MADIVNLPAPPGLAELGSMRVLYLPRWVAASSYPSWPIRQIVWDPTKYLIGAQTIYQAATAGKGAALEALTLAHFAVGMALSAMALQYHARVPAIPDKWGDRNDLIAKAPDLTSYYNSKASDRSVLLAAPFGFTRGGATTEEKQISRGARTAIRAMRRGPTTPTDGVSYVVEPSITGLIDKVPGIELVSSVALAALPAILLSVAVVAAIGVSQYFKADVEKKRIYYDSKTTKALAAIGASVQVTLDRQKKEAETGAKIAPSPLETSVAAQISTWTDGEPGGTWIGPVVGLGVGIGVTLGIGYAAKKWLGTPERASKRSNPHKRKRLAAHA